MIRITAARVLDNGDLDLDYVHPLEPTHPLHHHVIPVEAVKDRMVVYGTTSWEDALEQIVLETCARDVADRHRFPAKAERLHAHTTHGPVAGLHAALVQAGITIDPPTEQEVQESRNWFLHAFGQEGLERARGVARGSIDVHAAWPVVADQHAPVHPQAPG